MIKYSKAKTQAVVALLVIFLIPCSTYLFDLSVDVGEEIDLTGDENYADVLTDLGARMAYYQSLNVSMDPEQLGGEEVWRHAGGYVPYLNNYSNPQRRMQGMSRPAAAENAPTIVFILADDLGINDINFHDGSTWMDFATPQMDALASKGVVLSRHYVGWICVPTRGAFLTGRYPIRLGYSDIPVIPAGNLPKNESTLGDELQLLGYRTAIVGKWSLGFQEWDYYPTYRGFDTFYGYLHGAGLGYYSKNNSLGWFDLHEDEALVTDSESLELHLTTLLQFKVEGIIERHPVDFPGVPLFLYYAMQNVRFGGSEGYEAPQEYLDMCSIGSGDFVVGSLSEEDAMAYCALVVMMDEAVAKTVCALETAGLGENALVVVTSDNGAWKNIEGGNYPFRGAKGSITDGGIHVPTFMYGSIIPETARGTSYDGLVHITDWYVTFLNLASGNGWVAPTNGAELDGVYIFDAIIKNLTSPRTEIFHNYSPASGKGAMQIDTFKYVTGGTASITDPIYMMARGSLVPITTCSDSKSATTNSSSAPSTQPSAYPTISPSSNSAFTPESFASPTSNPTSLPAVEPVLSHTPLPSIVPILFPSSTTAVPSSAPTQLPISLPALQVSPIPTQPSSTLLSSATLTPTLQPLAPPTSIQPSTQSPTVSPVATTTLSPTSSSYILLPIPNHTLLLPTPSPTFLRMPTTTPSLASSDTSPPMPSTTHLLTPSPTTASPEQVLTRPPSLSPSLLPLTAPTSPTTPSPTTVSGLDSTRIPITSPTSDNLQTQSPTLPPSQTSLLPTHHPTKSKNSLENSTSSESTSSDDPLLTTNEIDSISPASEVTIMWATASIGVIAVLLFVFWASQKWKLRAAAERLAWTQ